MIPQSPAQKVPFGAGALIEPVSSPTGRNAHHYGKIQIETDLAGKVEKKLKAEKQKRGDKIGADHWILDKEQR